MFNELDETIENSNFEPVDWTPETGYHEKLLHKNLYPRPAAGIFYFSFHLFKILP